MASNDSGERTEKATPKRRKDAREKGQVRKSAEVVTSVMLLSIFGVLKFFGGWMAGQMQGLLGGYLGGERMLDVSNAAGFTRVMTHATGAFIWAMLPVFAVAVLAALLANYIQVGILFSTKALQPKMEHLNPLSGFKRMFSLKAIYETIKALGKLIIILVIIYIQMRKNMDLFLRTTTMGMTESVPLIFNAIINACFYVCLFLAIFSVTDYVYQWFKYEKDLKMTKYEVKTEFKQMEGDPEIKAKIKQKQRQMATARMMQDVPDADVVITNPTHFAVALQYDQKKNGAPVVLAKGQDLVAQRIKEIAKEHGVEIVENKPVARALYAGCQIGGEIPGELYGAVAEILAYVYKMKNGGRS